MILLGILALAAASAPCDEAAFITSQKANRADIDVKVQADSQTVETLIAQRNEIRERLVELDSMSSAKRQFRSTFNEDYDPRVLRGRDERIGLRIDGLKDEMAFFEAKRRRLDSEVKEFAARCAPENFNARSRETRAQ